MLMPVFQDQHSPLHSRVYEQGKNITSFPIFWEVGIIVLDFTDSERSTEKLSNLPRIPELPRGRAEI